MRPPPRRLVVVGSVVALLALLAGGLYALYRTSPLVHPPPGCTATGADPSAATGLDPSAPADPDAIAEYPLSPEQADNAATIAAVGTTLDMSEQAVTIALATALQESGLHNLTYGDRDSVGLFQQRPSQGWGSAEQIGDPVYASRAFYARLARQRDWRAMDVNDAAQAVQRSAVPDAYGQWEGEAGALAAALTGAPGATFTCHDLPLGRPESTLVTVARRELGTAALSGRHDTERGRQIGNWLVAHAVRFGIDRVTVNGSTWTAAGGRWAPTGPPDGLLSLHQIGAPTP